MNNTSSNKLYEIIICPSCRSNLTLGEESLFCNNCELEYPNNNKGNIDLRLKTKKTVNHSFKLGKSLIPEDGFDFTRLPINKDPEVDYSNISLPKHLTRKLLSYFPKAKSNNDLMLDLGCGNTVHKHVCEHAGYNYIGLDYENIEATLNGDAHSLPFKDDTFDFVLSIAVFEHIQFPFVAMREVNRVLKKGGVFIGTVAFLEPFHGDSYYHHTHLGTYNSLKEGGFKIKVVSPSKNIPSLKLRQKWDFSL